MGGIKIPESNKRIPSLKPGVLNNRKIRENFRFIDVNAIEIHSKQTSTNVCTNFLRLTATACIFSALQLARGRNLGPRRTRRRTLIVANDEWLTVKLTPDLETNWPVVFQLQV